MMFDIWSQLSARYIPKPCRNFRSFGVYVPIKNPQLTSPSLRRLSNKHADVVLSEHFLVIYVAVNFFASSS